MNTTSFETLSDDQLLIEVKRLVAVECSATAALLESLIEVDARRLYLREGCSSLFTYCTQVLHLAEGAAYNRIETARAARRFPALLEALASGSITLTAARLLAPHLTVENCPQLLQAAHHKSKREIELLLATLHPAPAVEAVLRKLPSSREPVSSVTGPCRLDIEQGARTNVEPAPVGAQERRPVPLPQQPRASVSPLSSATYKLQLTISADAHEKLRRVQDLLRHTIPNGDLAAILERALTLLLNDLERRRWAVVPSPRPESVDSPATRYIPASVRRDVWHRDGGRCAFVGASGRCTETGFLEFHHVRPYADGGAATVGNIQLRCRAHNLYEAALLFDEGHFVREVGLNWL